MHLQGGFTLTGESPDEIARRAFGPKAWFKPETDYGKILHPVEHDPHAHWVMARVIKIEELDNA